MGSLDIVLLRGICADYFDKHVAPVVKECRQEQDSISDQLKELSTALSARAEATSPKDEISDLLAKLEKKVDEQEQASMAKLEEIMTFISLKASAVKVDSLASKLESLSGGADVSRLEAIAAKLDLKANSNEVPTMAQFRELSTTVQLKADSEDVPTGLKVQMKKLESTVERKANSSKVDAQLKELSAKVDSKVDARLVPTVAQVEELEEEMKRKANSADVPSAKELHKLSERLDQKADVSAVPTKAELEELRDALASKADAALLKENGKINGMENGGKDGYETNGNNGQNGHNGWHFNGQQKESKASSMTDPASKAQLKELATVVERKLAFLASKLQDQETASRQQQQWSPQVVWMPADQVFGEWPPSPNGAPVEPAAGNWTPTQHQRHKLENGYANGDTNGYVNPASGQAQDGIGA